MRDDYPLFSGLLAYFPDALSEVARCSKVGNDQHNPGEPLHWARHKSTAHADKILRHLRDSITEYRDTDGVPHVVKVAWRALALAQLECERKRFVLTERTWTAEEAALLDTGSATGAAASSDGPLHKEADPAPPEAIEAQLERAEADDPQVGSLKAGEAQQCES